MRVYTRPTGRVLICTAANFLFFYSHSFLHTTWAARRKSSAKTFSAVEEIALGSLAGCIAKAVTTPISQIVVRQQSESSHAQKISVKARGKRPQKAEEDSDSDDEEAGENGVAQICREIVQERGWTG